MRALPLALLLAACASSSSSSSSREPRPKPNGNHHAMYAGRKPPPEEKMAILLVYSLPEEAGKTLIGRITSDATSADFRPPLSLRYFLLEPGRYRIEAYFWISRSRLENDKLLIENLQSAQIAPLEIVVDAGRAYCLRADVRKKDAVPAEARGAYYPLSYGSTLADAERLRSGDDSTFLGASEFVWRPELAMMTIAEQKQYWSHP
jgi:hypothetical protein